MDPCSQLRHNEEVQAGHTKTWPLTQCAKKELHYPTTSPSGWAMAPSAVAVLPVLSRGFLLLVPQLHEGSPTRSVAGQFWGRIQPVCPANTSFQGEQSPTQTMLHLALLPHVCPPLDCKNISVASSLTMVTSAHHIQESLLLLRHPSIGQPALPLLSFLPSRSPNKHSSLTPANL